MLKFWYAGLKDKVDESEELDKRNQKMLQTWLYLQFQKLQLFMFTVLWLALINHGLWKQSLDQLVYVVVGLKHLVSWYTVIVDNARMVQRVLHFLSQLGAEVQSSL